MKCFSLRHLAGLALLAALSASASAQVVRLAGGVSSLSAGEGGNVGLYEADRTSQIGFGFAQGLRVGASREVRQGNSTMIAGDTTIALRLPTDLQDAGRVLNARGLLLRTENAANRAQAFVGVTGSFNGNAYFTSVDSVRPVAVFSSDRTIGRAEISALSVSGERSSSLVSLAVRPNRENLVAMTTGLSAGAPIFRVAAHHGDGEEQVDVSYTAGQLKLQPQPDLVNSNLERIGWNISVFKHLTNWLFVDGARHEYATADAGNNLLWKGVTAARSQMLEGAASVQFGHLQGTARFFGSRSGNQQTSGYALMAVWHTRHAEARVTSVESTTSSELPDSPAPSAQTSTQMTPEVITRATFLESSQPVFRRIVLRESVNLGGGSNGFEAGGSYEGDRFSVSVGHREVFVPFGTQTGFRRLLVLGLRLRLHDTQTIAFDTIRGAGLPSTYSIASEGYYGEMAAGERYSESPTPRMARYVVRGRVLNQDKRPLRGAAVGVGRETVYTDSEGRFSARVNKKTAVPVVLRPAEFLTAQQYDTEMQPVMATPDIEGGQNLELSATLSKAPAATAQPAQSMSLEPDEEKISGWRKTAHLVKSLFRRMLSIRIPGHGA